MQAVTLTFGDRATTNTSGKDSLVATYQDYCKEFADVAGEAAIGEISTHNLYSAQAPALIRRYLPNAKLIAMLRHPAERAFSAFAHMVRDGREETEDFHAALAREPQRIRDNWEPLWHYKSMGFYGAQLSRYFDALDRNQIRVYIYDDFVARPLEVVQDIFSFVGVDPSFAPDMTERYNVSTILRSRRLNDMMMDKSLIRLTLRRLVPSGVRARIRSSILERNVKRLRLAPEVRRELTDAYREDIRLLERVLDRDLSRWLKPVGG